MSDVTFRGAVSTDVAQLIDLECRAFDRDTPDSRAHKQRELQHELPDYVVLAKDSRLIATARIQRHPLRVGKCVVLKGDVGHVAVAPELHGQGYGTALMQQLIPHMHEQGFHLSRLGGLMKFYARFGYEPFLRRYVNIPVPCLSSDLKGQDWRELLDLREPPAQVRPLDPVADHAAVHALRYDFDRGRSGQMVMPQEAGPPPASTAPPPLTWVYDDGRVRGYLRGAYALAVAGDTVPSYRVDELAFDPACPQAVGALVKTFMLAAQDRAPTTLTWCRLPFDEALFAALTAAGIAFDVVEMRQSLDGNMVQVINLPETLRAILPELSDRLAGVPHWEGTVRLILPNQQATLEVRGGEIGVTDAASADLVVEASQADFIKWLFGIVGFAESPQAQALPPAQRLVLSLLFPRLPCASGPWG